MASESRTIQDHFVKRLKQLDWKLEEWGKGVKGERGSLEGIILIDRFFCNLERNNKLTLEEDEKQNILSKLLSLPNTIEGIKAVLDFVKNGIPITLEREGKEIQRLLYLFDFDNVKENDFFAVREFEVEENEKRRRFDFCLFVNGIPIVGVETKNPVSPDEEGKSWYDAFTQVTKDYEKSIPSIFKFIQFCVVSGDGGTRYFPNYYAKEEDYTFVLEKDKGIWKSFFPFNEEEVKPVKTFPHLDSTIFGLLSHGNLLDLIENFIFVKALRDTFIKIMAWHTQFEATNLIVQRVIGQIETKKSLNRAEGSGLIWHWQGSGKSLTMAFSSWKLLRSQKMESPTIFVIVDRKDLQDQISKQEFRPIGIEMEQVENITELAKILQWGGKEREGKRGVFVSLIQKFNPVKLYKLHQNKQVNLERKNIIIFTDESHRSQYKILANTMRSIFKNAFIFGFTGTPLTKEERNTFAKFSPKGELYLHRYGMLQSVNDGLTLGLRYEARLPELHLKLHELDELSDYEEDVVEELKPQERAMWKRKVRTRLAVMKSPERIDKLAKDIAKYYEDKIRNTPFKAMIATVDRECAVLLKEELDKHLDSKLSEVIITHQAREKSGKLTQFNQNLIKRFKHSDFEQINDTLRDRFRFENEPRIVIVSDMLLTGFDAPNLWTLFIYKPLKEHRLLQAVARTNRPFIETKEFGLIVDYVGVADNLEKAIQQFEGDFKDEVLLIWKGIEYSEKEFETIIGECKVLLGNIQLHSLEDIDNAVQLLVLNKKEQEFLQKVRKLRTLFESLFPSEPTLKHLDYYKWLISTSVALRKYRLGDGMHLIEIEQMAKKTYQLIQNTIGVDAIRKIGEVDLSTKLEEESEPIQALKEIAEVQRKERKRTGGISNFYKGLSLEVEAIVEEMRQNKTVTKEVVDKIRRLQAEASERQKERERLGNAFSVYDVLRSHSFSDTKSQTVSREIIEELSKEELLNKEAFLIGRYRREIKARVRENIIKNFGLAENIDEIEDKIFLNLEQEYEKEEPEE